MERSNGEDESRERKERGRVQGRTSEKGAFSVMDEVADQAVGEGWRMIHVRNVHV
jgi:hypothetical protein